MKRSTESRGILPDKREEHTLAIHLINSDHDTTLSQELINSDNDDQIRRIHIVGSVMIKIISH